MDQFYTPKILKPAYVGRLFLSLWRETNPDKFQLLKYPDNPNHDMTLCVYAIMMSKSLQILGEE